LNRVLKSDEIIAEKKGAEYLICGDEENALQVNISYVVLMRMPFS
jgi:hypothetical protein